MIKEIRKAIGVAPMEGVGSRGSMLDVFHHMGMNVVPVKDGDDDSTFLRVLAAQFGGFQVQPNPDDFHDQLKIHKMSALVYRCSQLWAESVIQAPVRIERWRDGKFIESITSGPIWDVLREVNGHISLQEWIYSTVLNLALTGNAYTWKVRDRNNNIVELWPFRPDEIQIAFDPFFDPKGKLRYEWRPISSGGIVGAAGPFFFRRENLLHNRLPSPLSQVYGTGPVRAAHDDILADQRAKRGTLSMLENEGVPAGVLQTESILTEDQANIIKERWRTSHGGPDRSGKIAVLGAGTKFVPITVTPKDIEWLNQRKMSRAGVLMAFGVPPIYAGMEGENFANRKEQRLLFWQDTLRPKLRLMEAQFTEFLLRDWDPELVWRFDESVVDVFVEARASRVVAAAKAADPQRRIMRPFEARKLILGIEERFPGDDEWLVTSNAETASNILEGQGAAQAGQRPAGNGGAPPVGAQVPEEDLSPEEAAMIVDALAEAGAPVAADGLEYSEKDMAKLERMSAKERALSARFGRKIGRFFRSLSGEIERRIGEGKNDEDLILESQALKALPNEGGTEEALFTTSEALLRTAFRTGFAEGVQDIEEALKEFESGEEEETVS